MRPGKTTTGGDAKRFEVRPTPWGAEIPWARAARYAAKLLHVAAGRSLSLQYHRAKDESMFCLCGRAVALLGRAAHPLAAGSALTIPAGTPHRVAAIEDTLLLEVSTPELGDTVRLADAYGRPAHDAGATEAGDRGANPAKRGPDGRNCTASAEYRGPMARENRLVSIAIMLASGQRLRASDVAERFSVSERTVYRDMQRLADRGFPLAAIPGPNGGYAIFRHVQAELVQLALDEAVALAIGAGLAARLVSPNDSGAARRALQKIQAALPDTVSCALPEMMTLFSEGDQAAPERNGPNGREEGGSRNSHDGRNGRNNRNGRGGRKSRAAR